MQKSLSAQLSVSKHLGRVSERATRSYGWLADPQLPTPLRVCRDNRLADTPDAEYVRGVAGLAGSMVAHDAGARLAIVVATDVSFGMARMFEAYADTAPFDVCVFRCMRAAVDWLRS